MSDLSGVDAFDNLMDRLLHLKEHADRYERASAEAQRENRDLRDGVRRLEQRMQSAAADAMHYRSLVPTDVLKADDEKRRPAAVPAAKPDSNDIPF